ncbi:GNAT family N-acetyltransferase [Corynebacterium sp. CCM 9186]|uniref:GNAT family N-acetyltransferase n=1 Tax=Corynebacterium meridianum TaxID=2765363 RepID=UPI002004E322|nr:GNAT family N-acetyltransferase [Corynebacterium meridianum]MCK7677261.1 GNAT family N-acetyltransferase [Corynebacterium meridianum]
MELSFHPILDPMTFSKHVRRDYEFAQYWTGTYRLGPEQRWFEVRDDGEQVALLELDLKPNRSFWRGTHYALPIEGPDVVEIQFIDVRTTHRGRGVGTAVVGWVAQQYPQRQMLALAEASDGFWQSLGWERIEPDESGYRPMYTSPL